MIRLQLLPFLFEHYYLLNETHTFPTIWCEFPVVSIWDAVGGLTPSQFTGGAGSAAGTDNNFLICKTANLPECGSLK